LKRYRRLGGVRRSHSGPVQVSGGETRGAQRALPRSLRPPVLLLARKGKLATALVARHDVRQSARSEDRLTLRRAISVRAVAHVDLVPGRRCEGLHARVAITPTDVQAHKTPRGT